LLLNLPITFTLQTCEKARPFFIIFGASCRIYHVAHYEVLEVQVQLAQDGKVAMIIGVNSDKVWVPSVTKEEF
jgi:hypothetical protein